MEHRNWTCPKCDHRSFEASEMHAAGGFWSKIFDVQNRRFSTVSCTRCQYTELYRVSTTGLANVFDFFTG